MLGDLRLTAVGAAQVATHPGQAHFAVPDGAHTCRECEHWLNRKGERDSRGLLKAAPCKKAFALRNPPPVPHTAKECRYFQLNEEAPPV